MRRELLVCALVALLFTGCPKGGASTSGDSTCGRSVAGDTETARTRLERDRVDEAVLYVDGLIGCEDALAHAPFLDVAFAVYEELGRLNDAWNVALIGTLRTLPSQAEGRLWRQRSADFEGRYALILSPPDHRGGLSIAYTGPALDEATAAQLAAVRAGDGVAMEGNLVGFWVYPATYRIEGQTLRLAPGQTLPDPRP